ncbi:MAG: hypothetical protein KID04_10855 [Clostridium sp.]|nr:hypothetical protein [Clostridium sp.]
MKNELLTLRLFSPLFPHIYRKNEWGDMDDYREDLTAGEVLEYEDKILALIQKEKLPSEGQRGLAVYLDDDLSRKVYRINPSVEEWNGELYVSFWDGSVRFFIKPEDELKSSQTFGFGMSM